MRPKSHEKLHPRIENSVIRQLTPKVALHLAKTWQPYKNLSAIQVILRQMNSRRFAAVTLRQLLSRLVYELPHADMAYHIGLGIEEAFRLGLRRDPKDESRRLRTMRQAIGFRLARSAKFTKPWDKFMVCKIGGVGLYSALEASGICQRIDHPTKRKPFRARMKVIAPTPEFSEWLIRNQVLLEEYLEERKPKTEPFKDWASLRHAELRDGLIRSSRVQPPEVTAEEIQPILQSVNHLQKTGWRINEDVFKVYEQAFHDGVAVGGLPHRVEPTLDRLVSKREWAGHVHQVGVHKMRGRNAAYTLATAKNLRDRPIFYAWNIDWRGRLYPLGHRIHPQGDDIGRGLLEFQEPTPMTSDAKFSLAEHGAAMWGHKGSIEEMHHWVAGHEDRIIYSAQNPLDHRWWAEAGEPWKFLAFCFEWHRQANADFRAPTHLPCLIDGSANFLQIASLLLRDEELAASCNVTPGPRVDVYRQIADRATELLRGHTWGDEWLEIMGGSVQRAPVKRAVIAFSFGRNAHVAAQDICGWFWDQGHDFAFGGEIRKPSAYFCRVVQEAMGPLYTRMQELHDWTKDLCNQAISKGRIPEWRAATGLPIRLRYVKRRNRRVDVNRRQTSLQKFTFADELESGEIDVRRLRAAAPANLLQHFDAVCMTRAVNQLAADGCQQLNAIHDGLALPAPQIALAHQRIREAYAEIFAEDQLGLWAMQIAGSAQHLPRTGALDASCLLDSDYFFA